MGVCYQERVSISRRLIYKAAQSELHMENEDEPLNAFSKWLKTKERTTFGYLPLTHVTKAINLEKIIVGKWLKPTHCPNFDEDILYTFYGRAAYRVAGDGVIRNESLSPVCLVFNGELIKRAKNIFPFDTGAYKNRMYKHHFGDELKLDDYSIGTDIELPNQLIQSLYKTVGNYFDADTRIVPPRTEVTRKSDMSAGLYLDLIKSEGRNEPDDRVGSIEVLLQDAVKVADHLRCIILPDAFDVESDDGEWLELIRAMGCQIRFYKYVPGKGPDYYHCHLETELRKFFIEQGHVQEAIK